MTLCSRSSAVDAGDSVRIDPFNAFLQENMNEVPAAVDASHFAVIARDRTIKATATTSGSSRPWHWATWNSLSQGRIASREYQSGEEAEAA
jgi:hypothetical protein